jgi:YD repeat-containing protein
MLKAVLLLSVIFLSASNLQAYYYQSQKSDQGFVDARKHYYNSDGRFVGSSQDWGNGTTLYNNDSGRLIYRSQDWGNGNTFYYDDSGKMIGRESSW